MMLQWLPALFTVVVSTDMFVGDRPRGVAMMKAPFYDPSKEFHCLDGSGSIPFSQVNDDYCDCADGTDEPGTAACPTGQFNCINLGHSPSDIPSSRVNDMICDCCDGSDEWAGYVQCPNICQELGRKAREEADRIARIQREGYQKRQEMASGGAKVKEEKKKKVEEFAKQKAELEPQKEELDNKKKAVEALESEAKKKHQEAWEATKSQLDSEKEKKSATAAFKDLDLNLDGRIQQSEIQARPEFDKDGDGDVSADEANDILADEEPNMETFIESTWNQIRDSYRSQHHETATEPPVPTHEVPVPPAPPSPTTPRPPRDYDEPDDDDEDEDEMPEGAEIPEDFDSDKYMKEGEKKPVDEEMPPYDDETLKLIEDADKAREDFREMELKLRDVESELERAQKFVDLDFGPSAEFLPLMGQCFELEQSEYVYRLCPFEKASQKNKGGGAETSLGSWGTWAGPDNKYTWMKYEGGLGCWNGPDRSTIVELICDLENRLISVKEPAKCEYHFVFATPAICEQVQAGHEHTEL